MLAKTGTTYSAHWHSTMPCLTPRGQPAPGGGANQFPKDAKTPLTATPLVRLPRPFTHASTAAAHELMLQAKESIWLSERVKAIPKLVKAIEIEPNFPEALALLGKLRQEDRQVIAPHARTDSRLGQEFRNRRISGPPLFWEPP